ncbi:hypothetical protein [Thermococcus sp.]
MSVKILPFLWGRRKPEMYEMVITQDGLSLEGNERLGAHIEDVLSYVERKSEELRINKHELEIYIKDDHRVIAIRRIGGLGVAVVSSTLEDAIKALKDIEGRVDELLFDKYEETLKKFQEEENAT